jgi:hypothetical protein
MVVIAIIALLITFHPCQHLKDRKQPIASAASSWYGRTVDGCGDGA